MEKMLHEISRFFVVPRREFAPAVRARPHTPFSINTSTSVCLLTFPETRLCPLFGVSYKAFCVYPNYKLINMYCLVALNSR